MKKPTRNFQENHYVAEFLNSSENLINFVKLGNVNITDLINNISYSLKYEFAQKYKVLYRIGIIQLDNNNLYYINLNICWLTYFNIHKLN